MDTRIFIKADPEPLLVVESPAINGRTVTLSQDQLVAAWNLSPEQKDAALALIGDANECERPGCRNMAHAHVDKTWQCIAHIAMAHSDYTTALWGDL